MMLSMISMYEQNRNDLCNLCSSTLSEIKSYPNVCDHLFHYKCLRNYVDTRLDKNEAIVCPICEKIFHQIGNKYKKSKEVLYQNVILSNDETQCCICFSKYKCPVASTDTCSHTFCFECIKRWCTFKHECPMDRMPIKLLLMSDFPGGHIIKKEEPPPIEQDLNGDGDNDEILNTTCEICNLGNNDHLLLLCDNCNRGYHIYCLTTPLTEIPEGDWFCDECSNDVVVNNQSLPRGLRGLHRVINDLQVRYDSNQERTTRNEPNTNRRNRSRRALPQPVSDDSDWGVDVSQHSSPRRDYGTNQGGIRRSLRNRTINSEERLVTRSNASSIRQDEISQVTEVYDELLSRNRRRVIEDSEEESPTIPIESNNDYLRNINVVRTRNRNRIASQFNEDESSDREENAVSGRNRQGSLSSEPESEIEKKQLADETSSSSEESSEESVKSLQVTTRKRARNAIKNEEGSDDDCPLPRPVKKLRILEESTDNDSDDSMECDDSSKSESSEADSSMKDIIGEENESSDESSEERKRHISTSSSLSTIPCRTSSRITVPNRETVTLQPKKRIRQCTKVDDIFSDSSNFDNTDSDYLPSSEKTIRQPSTSKRPSTSKSVKVRKKRTKKSKRTKRKTVKKTTKRGKTSRKKRKSSRANKTITAIESDVISPRKLSIFGREKHLPVVSDEELKIKQVARPAVTANSSSSATRPVNSNNSILSEITEAQTNFRTISLSTITRLPNGTLIHKSRTDQIDSTENKDPKVVNEIPSTSSQYQEPSVSHNPPAQVHIANPTLNSSNHEPHNVHIDYLKNVIGKFLNRDEYKRKITKEENKILSDRIIEKVMKRNNQKKTPGKSSVEDFSRKYLEFYLKRKK